MKTVITFIVFLICSIITLGQVNVTPASGGTDLPRSTSSANGDPGGYVLLGDIVIAEGDKIDFSHSGNLILNAPFNWQFNTSASVLVDVTSTGSPKVSATLTDVSAGTITILVIIGDVNKVESITISGIEVQAIDGTIAPAAGNITPSGTATIVGLTSSTNLGSLSLDPSSPLPVELTSFSAIIKDKSVNLSWVTETEVNSYGFEVQRLNKTDTWEILGFVEGHGNSNSPKRYNFIDNKVNATSRYSYRLKMIDNDGTFEYSKTLEVNLAIPTTLDLNQNYPNPFNPSTTISFTLPESGNVSLKIFNPLGEEVATLINGFTEAGSHTFNFSAKSLPSGMYIYQLSTNKNTLTKKMLLLK